MKILLLVSAFNGLTQRVWCDLRRSGHDVSVELASAHTDEDGLASAVAMAAPDLIICPFLKHRVPQQVWGKFPTVIIHPGPIGDRGPSSLDYAIAEAAPRWGVTALSAVEEMDAGPIWAHREFDMPQDPPSKAALYNGLVADAAVECVREVVAKAADPRFRPTSQDQVPRPIDGTRTRPSMPQSARAFSWSDSATSIVRRVRAADSAPGVRATIDGRVVSVYDAAVGETVSPGTTPGTILGHDGDAIAIAARDAAVWIGHVKEPANLGGNGVKLPASAVFDVADRPALTAPAALRAARYERRGDVGMLRIRAYNGAMSTRQCERVATELRAALAQDTRVLVVTGTDAFFSNGINLNVIETAPDPAAEAWANITAINELCTLLVSCVSQLTVAAFGANAGAGGVMLGLAADVVVARSGVVLNPFYDMGLYGSELHTYTLPRRVGAGTAQRLLTEKLPVDADDAARIGLVDAVGPRDAAAFDGWLWDLAESHANPQWHNSALDQKLRLLGDAFPPAYYEAQELSQMARDFFEDRNGFAAARAAFVGKHTPDRTPARLAAHRWSLTGER